MSETCVSHWHIVDALGVVIDALTPMQRMEICERLQILATIQEKKGEILGACFSRALSGEEPPINMHKPTGPQLRLVADNAK